MTKHSFNILETCKKNNVGLNSGKLKFKQEKVNFYEHTLTEKGLQPVEDKLQVIKYIKVPENAAELLTILGMINYLNRFSVNLAENTAPLRELTKKHVHFRWEPHHQVDFIIISYYDPNPSTPTIYSVMLAKLDYDRQQKQAKVYNKKAGINRRILNNMETVYVRNTVKKVWESGVILNR